jgi:signal transduction histidine kinase
LSAAEKIKILYVDDENVNLVGFKASFRMDYQILTANNTTDAAELLSKNPDIRIIFCDQRMPDKTGVDFFKEIRSTYPHPIRILLTAYTDMESLIEAINLSNIYRYVKKPWEEIDVISSIEEANKFYLANSIISVKNDELQKAYNELDKFAYSVTHDIRAPLLSVLGAIDAAQYIDNITELKEMLTMMQDSVKNLDHYIQNLHEYYNLKRGELKFEEINFNDVVKAQEETFRLTARLNNVDFKVNVMQRETFRCDKTTIKIILTNLLSNAFKYQRRKNPHKTVELNINVANGLAVITVHDNGIGIHGSHINDIFTMFFRATLEEVGSGFGLYNVKDALLKLNGEIAVESKEGEGSVFKVTLPNK